MLTGVGIFVSQNPRLKKYEAKFEEIDIDILKTSGSEAGRLQVILPEPLLLLKAKAGRLQRQSGYPFIAL